MDIYREESKPTINDAQDLVQAEIVLSNKGGPKLIHDGFMYTLHKKQTNNIRWRCVLRTSQCRGSLVTSVDYMAPKVRMEHNHGPDYGAAKLARKRYMALGQPPVFPASSENSMADFEAGPSKRLKPCASNRQDKASLKLGETYDSFEALTSAVKKFQKQDYNVYYKRDTTTVKVARKKGLKRSIKQTLEYYSIKYCCIHGGKQFKTKSKGVRSSSTFQKSCGAFFRIGINQSGDKYVITETHLVHNHKSTKKLYEHLPQVRSLDVSEKDKVASLLKLDASKKKVRDEISAETANVVLLKDLSNIVVCRDSLDRNNLEDTITRVKEKYGKVFNAWKIVSDVVHTKKENCFFACGRCKADVDEPCDEPTTSSQSNRDWKLAIRCDYCLIWYHLPCASLKSAPKARIWKCRFCS